MAKQTLKARPTTYAGVKMRSRLEADYAAALDHAPKLKWEYEPVCFAGPSGQWLPDFRVTNSDGIVAYVELKPAALLLPGQPSASDDVLKILRQMEVAWLSEPDVRLWLCAWTYQARAFTFMYHGRLDGGWRIVLPGTGGSTLPGPAVGP